VDAELVPVAVAEHCEVLLSVGFSTRSTKKLPARLASEHLPNERKNPVCSWTIRENVINPGIDGVCLEGYPMRALLPQLPRVRHLLSAEQRRALEILAAAGRHGCAGAALLGHGFRVGMLADLVGDGLAAARRETVMVHKREIAVVRGCITEAGQKSIKVG
jgi:hypothetical protein